MCETLVRKTQCEVKVGKVSAYMCQPIVVGFKQGAPPISFSVSTMYILMPLRAVEFEEGAPGGNNRYRYIHYCI